MIKMKCTGSLIATFLISCSVNAFQSSTIVDFARLSKPHNDVSRSWTEIDDRHTTLLSLQRTSDEARAAGFSDYMIKAHEEKLRAINEIERRRREETRALQEELAELRSLLGDTPRHSISKAAAVGMQSKDSPTNLFSTMSKEALIQVAEQYHSFISKYIVDSSIEKHFAVKAAEAALNQKWEERLRVMSESTSLKTSTAVDDTKIQSTASEYSAVVRQSGDQLPSKSTQLYIQRNAAVLAAGSAGKARWGEMELDKIRQINSNLLNLQSKVTDLSVPSRNQNQQDEIQKININHMKDTIASDSTSILHSLRNEAVRAAGIAGKSRWGKMELDKINKSSVTTGATSHHVAATLQDMRNAAVTAAGAAGKSRWGPMELNRINKPSVTTGATIHHLAVTLDSAKDLRVTDTVSNLQDLRNAAVSAAGVAGKSRWGPMELNRINKPSVATGATIHHVTATPESNLQDLRNAAVSAAGAAGKSRWGTMELNRINKSSTSASVTAHKAVDAVGSVYNAHFSASVSNLQALRKAAVRAAGVAGKSRWGPMELPEIVDGPSCKIQLDDILLNERQEKCIQTAE